MQINLPDFPSTAFDLLACSIRIMNSSVCGGRRCSPVESPERLFGYDGNNRHAEHYD